MILCIVWWTAFSYLTWVSVISEKNDGYVFESKELTRPLMPLIFAWSKGLRDTWVTTRTPHLCVWQYSRNVMRSLRTSLHSGSVDLANTEVMHYFTNCKFCLLLENISILQWIRQGKTHQTQTLIINVSSSTELTWKKCLSMKCPYVKLCPAVSPTMLVINRAAQSYLILSPFLAGLLSKWKLYLIINEVFK